ncbi:choice-of-anchor I family protein [Neomicrococcus lactis]|uniref:Choice-of-anchor I domain-containing protein n=1 Tax=Neomicrococcus lactis TaxID=732241 RepID=A0A7W8YC70_9MICC|nr:hypothetical protein [Neomicrococcus lactis]
MKTLGLKHGGVKIVAIAALAACATTAVPASAAVVPTPVNYSSDNAAISLAPLDSYDTEIFDSSAAEIVQYVPESQRILTVNAQAGEVDVLDASDPKNLVKEYAINAAGVKSADGSVIPEGAVANSVAVREDGLGVVAVEAPNKTDAGWLVYFNANANAPTIIGAVRVGSLPDMVTITPNGATALVANEGEPAEDYSVDPEGSISVVTLPKTLAANAKGFKGSIAQNQVKTAGFHAFENNVPEGVRIFGGREDATGVKPEFPVSENLEPEYIAVSENGAKAYVSLQEANAVAVVSVNSGQILEILPLGTVDRTEIAMDASDKDKSIGLKTWPVQGFRMPDALGTYKVQGMDYFVTANEGDSRDWAGYSEESRMKDFGKDGIAPVCESVAEEAGLSLKDLRKDENLGRLNLTTAQGLNADGSCYETLYAFGGRGFSIFDPQGNLVFESGSEFEEIVAKAVPEYFNSNHTEAKFDGRSDDKGPEPEGLSLGKIDGRTYAFIGLERVGGVMVYDITNPRDAKFVTYVNNRDFSNNTGDLGPEGLDFVSATDSPTGKPLVVVGNEVSGSTSVFEITVK